jgi:hypothetical protein
VPARKASIRASARPDRIGLAQDFVRRVGIISSSASGQRRAAADRGGADQPVLLGGQIRIGKSPAPALRREGRARERKAARIQPRSARRVFQLGLAPPPGPRPHSARASGEVALALRRPAPHRRRRLPHRALPKPSRHIVSAMSGASRTGSARCSPEHRRGQHRGVECRPSSMIVAAANARPSNGRSRRAARAAARANRDQGGEILDSGSKLVDFAARPPRAALPAPVERRDVPARACQCA